MPLNWLTFYRVDNLTVTKLVKLLLIIILVVQPVSYAAAMAGMTGMNQSHHSTMTALMSHDDQQNHHAMTKNGMDPQAQHAYENENAADTCCNNVACCQAFVTSEFTVQQNLPHSHYEHSVDTPMKSIDLPAAIKPPRRLPV